MDIIKLLTTKEAIKITLGTIAAITTSYIIIISIVLI